MGRDYGHEIPKGHQVYNEGDRVEHENYKSEHMGDDNDVQEEGRLSHDRI